MPMRRSIFVLLALGIAFMMLIPALAQEASPTAPFVEATATPDLNLVTPFIEATPTLLPDVIEELSPEVSVEPTATPIPVTNEECARIVPNASASFFIGAGDAFFTQQDYTQAIRIYTCALLTDVTFAPAYAARGYAYFVQRADPEALADFNRAIELEPENVQAYNYRGMLYTVQGNFGLALGDFTVAVTLDPTYDIAFNNRAVVHAAEGNYDLARDDIEAALALNPDESAHYATRSALYMALALVDYNEYRALAGLSAPYPGGSPRELIDGLQSGVEIGSFSAWLGFLKR